MLGGVVDLQALEQAQCLLRRKGLYSEAPEWVLRLSITKTTRSALA